MTDDRRNDLTCVVNFIQTDLKYADGFLKIPENILDI